MHMSRGLPLISAEQEPHLPALQFQRTARSLACVAWTRLAMNSCRLAGSNLSFVKGPNQDNTIDGRLDVEDFLHSEVKRWLRHSRRSALATSLHANQNPDRYSSEAAHCVK